MSELGILFLVAQYPNPLAIARRVRDGSVFPALRHLEASGLLWRQQNQYRLTRRGREELALTTALLLLGPPRTKPARPMSGQLGQRSGMSFG
jgi:hypothetical protein